MMDTKLATRLLVMCWLSGLYMETDLEFVYMCVKR